MHCHRKHPGSSKVKFRRHSTTNSRGRKYLKPTKPAPLVTLCCSLIRLPRRRQMRSSQRPQSCQRAQSRATTNSCAGQLPPLRRTALLPSRGMALLPLCGTALLPSRGAALPRSRGTALLPYRLPLCEAALLPLCGTAQLLQTP